MTSINPKLIGDLPYRQVFALAVPASIAASVTPLLGAIDVWALGRSERPLDIAAVGLAAVIFSLTYWTFGFIRMSVAGLSAQAAGAGSEDEVRAALFRGIAIGGGIGAALVLLQQPIGAGAISLLGLQSAASAETLAGARDYYDIRIWGAPFALGTYALLGWLSARGRTDYLMATSVLMTALNALLDWHFVLNLGLGAKGVAFGTLIAEIAGFLSASFFAMRIMKANGGLATMPSIAQIIDPMELRRTLSINRDIFIRTLILAAAYAWFTQRGGAFGDVTLAANQVLMQLFLFTGLALDGTAIAAETMVGQAIGRSDRVRARDEYAKAVRATFIVASICAAAFTLAYFLAGNAFVALLTPPGLIRDMALTYLPWVIISPLIVAAGFQLDGIFIGATRAREMRDAMIATGVLIFPLTVLLAGRFGNHGLWAAFTLYFIFRAITLAIFMPRIARGISER